VHDILAIIDAEWDEAATKAETEQEEKDTKQPAETTSLINGSCCDGSMASRANAHDRRSTKAKRLNDSRDRLSDSDWSRSSISHRLGRSRSISNRGRLTRGHLSGVGVHGRLACRRVSGGSRLLGIYFRSRGHDLLCV